MAGKLYLCATPIGNLEDITYRVVRTLNEVDLIGAEDTRNSIKLLNHFDIKTPMTSYHEFNKYDKAKQLVEMMKEGKNIAIITDAGTPGISDPGEEVVRQCFEAGIQVTSLPGPAACITALTMSGQKTRRFCFEAFLPKDKKEKVAVLEELKNETRTMIFYEAPHKLNATLRDMLGAFGNRSIAIVRELTKIHEEVIRTTLEQAVERYSEAPLKGEIVLVIDGAKPVDNNKVYTEEEAADLAIALAAEEDVSLSEASKKAAKETGIKKGIIYKLATERDEVK